MSVHAPTSISRMPSGAMSRKSASLAISNPPCRARTTFRGLRHLISAWNLRIPIVAAGVGIGTLGGVAVAHVVAVATQLTFHLDCRTLTPQTTPVHPVANVSW